MKETLKPKVYVGTYKKYNEASLRGGWVTLTDYKDYASFMAACFKLHKDERDPELMIQDTEDMPDGLSVMESISEQEFNDIIEACREQSEEEESAEEHPKFRIIDYSEKAVAVVGDTKDIKEQLKALCGRFNPKLSCGEGWIFSKKMLPELEKLLKNGKVEKPSAQPKADEGAKYKKWLEEYASTQKDADYYRKHCVGAVKLNDGYYLMSKPSIETKFCFHDEGPNYEFYKELMADDKKMKDYFIDKNLRNIDIRIDQLQSMRPMVITSSWSNNRKSYEEENYRYEREGDVRMTETQRSELVKALQWKRTQFEKRLQSYLKRYGLTKIHAWTYWKDA